MCYFRLFKREGGGVPPPKKKDINEHIHGGLGGFPPNKSCSPNESLDTFHSGNTVGGSAHWLQRRCVRVFNVSANQCASGAM